MREWLLSIQALVVQWTAFLVALLAFLAALGNVIKVLGKANQTIWRLFKHRAKPRAEEEDLQHRHDKSPLIVRQGPLILTGTIFAIVGVAILGGRHVVAQGSLRAPFSINGYFFPSGFMGDGGGEKGSTFIDLNDQWKGNCHPGPACIRISYRPGKKGWGGIYWQFPDGNWGDKPGRSIESAKKVTFFARGEKGGELVVFKAGGINDPKMKYHDSFERTLDPNPVELKTEWERFEIDLTRADTSSVLGAFAWVANRNGNPDGLTFYLDAIRYE